MGLFLDDPWLQRLKKAKTIILSLWDYYASDAQISRFDDVIKNPSLANDSMRVPHIRFDGSSEKLGDVMVDGKAQNWNHRQIDAHGLFLLALNDAFDKKLVKANDLSKQRLLVLSKFPAFFKAIKYWSYEDSGAWEEIERKNTSSIAAVSQALYRISTWHDSKLEVKKFLSKWAKKQGAYWKKKSLYKSHIQGLKTVKKQIRLGGESPVTTKR